MLAGREPAEEDMEPLSWWVWRRARALDAVSANLAAVRMQTLARAVVTWAQPYDAILSPTLAEAPLPHRHDRSLRARTSATFARGAAFTPFTAISNVTGSPAISLPLAVHPGGLPLGVQLVGRPAGEGPLLALAAQLEAARPWSEQARTIPGSQRDWSREPPMAYVIAEPCIGTKDNSCVEVCPVDCIHPTPDEPDYDKVEQLYIDPEECIDCDACVEACPVDACFAEDQLPSEWAGFSQINPEYFTSRLKPVPDVVGPGLQVLFCGINPSIRSGETGFHFARPGNRFWPALHLAGFTPRVLRPDESAELPSLRGRGDEPRRPPDARARPTWPTTSCAPASPRSRRWPRSWQPRDRRDPRHRRVPHRVRDGRRRRWASSPRRSAGARCGRCRTRAG